MSGIYQPDTKQQLAMLKEQTRLTGALHEAQVLQLKMWPLVLFQNAKTAQFSWDPDKKSVSFDVQVTGRMPGAKVLEERTKVLNGWVQELLGDEWIVVVTIAKGKTKTTLRGVRSVRSGNSSLAGR